MLYRPVQTCPLSHVLVRATTPTPQLVLQAEGALLGALSDAYAGVRSPDSEPLEQPLIKLTTAHRVIPVQMESVVSLSALAVIQDALVPCGITAS
jgi:hypothetical protein